jgi:hypothetical protein
MNEEMSFIMHTPEGDVTMHVLFTFESPETKAFYMLYTPDPLDSPTPVRLSACRFNPDDPTKILPLQGENDRKIVQGFINYISTHTPEEIAEAAPLA